jgi:hypothetical protein
VNVPDFVPPVEPFRELGEVTVDLTDAVRVLTDIRGEGVLPAGMLIDASLEVTSFVSVRFLSKSLRLAAMGITATQYFF